MFLFIKLLTPIFFSPLVFVVAIGAGFFFYRRNKKYGRWIIVASLIMLYALSTEIVARSLVTSLERRVSSVATDMIPADVSAIVVLAGGADKKDAYHPFAELGGVSWRRLWQGIVLYRVLNGRIPLLYSGGSGNPFDPVSDEAVLAKEYAVSAGIPAEQFLIESSSRNTAESGRAIKTILESAFPKQTPKRIVLVTSAWHMPRSLAIMQRVGIDALPYSADFRGGVSRISFEDFFPSNGSFVASFFALHEWIGIVGYRILGWI
ncbi:MAG: YdcF family protein [bacterium]|nr:YdcF family protein [bacterium]